MTSNSKLECPFCPVSVFSKDLYNHTFKNHQYELYLAPLTDVKFGKNAEANRKALASKTIPLVIKSTKIDDLYCCLKCNRALVKDRMCRHYHFNFDEDDQNHSVAHREACKALLVKVNARIESGVVAPQETPLAPSAPQAVVKVEYRDAPGGGANEKAVMSCLGALLEDIYKNDYILSKNAYQINNLTELLESADLSLKRQDLLIEKLREKVRMTDYEYKEMKEECDEAFKTTTVAKVIRNRQELHIAETIKRNDIYDPWEEYDTEFDRLKESMPSLSLKEIKKHIPKVKDD